MNRILTRRRVVASLTVAVLGLAACSGSDDAETSDPPETVDDDQPTTGPETTVEVVEGGTINWAISSDPGNLDPQMSPVNVNVQMAPFAYDPLVHRNKDGVIVTGLAESWEPQGNGYAFTLREDITCSDGSPLNASDVAANFEFAGNPENGSAYVGSAIPPAPIVTADDEARTVTVDPTEPFPFLLEGLALFPIVCKSGLDDRESLAGGTAGTGPFVLSDSTPGQEYTYTLREGYTWGPDGASTAEPGLPDTVVFRVVSNETTATNQLIEGEINIAEVVGPERDRLADVGLFSDSYLLGLAQMYFNETEGRPGADEAVRRAITMGIDLEELATVVSGGYGSVPTGLTFAEPRICGADTVTEHMPTHDPEGARAVLDEAGWTEGPDGVRSKDGTPLKVTLMFITNSGSGFGTDPAAELTAERLKDIGVEVELLGGTTEVLGPILFGSGDWDVAWVPVSRGVPSQLIPLFSGAAPPDGLNFSHISNPEYEELVQSASQKVDASGCPEWEAAEEALLKRVDVVPFVETSAPVWGAGVTFEVSGEGIVRPMSLRAVES